MLFIIHHLAFIIHHKAITQNINSKTKMPVGSCRDSHTRTQQFTLGKPTWGKNPAILSLENLFNKRHQSHRQTDQHKMAIHQELSQPSTKFQVKTSSICPQVLLLTVKVCYRSVLGPNFGLLCTDSRKLGLITATENFGSTSEKHHRNSD